MNINRKVIYLKDYKEQKQKLNQGTLCYIPITYVQAIFDIVKRHHPNGSKEEIKSEFERCKKIAIDKNFPSKALLSTLCYGYFCPSDLEIEEKPKNQFKASDIFIAFIGIGALCSAISSIVGVV